MLRPVGSEKGGMGGIHFMRPSYGLLKELLIDN
jgi:hypothetical protein